MPYENPIINDIKKGTFHPVYLLYGPEPYLRRNYKDKLIRALVQPGDSINFSKFNEDNYDSEALVELCQTMPLFAEKRVVLCDLCKAFSKSDEKLSDYLSSPNDFYLAALLFNFSDNLFEILREQKSDKHYNREYD